MAGRSVYVTIHPSVPSPQDVVAHMQTLLRPFPKFQPAVSKIPNPPFFYMGLNNINDANKVVNLTGQHQTPSNQTIFISLAPKPEDTSAYEFFNSNLSTLFEGQTYNLSNLRKQGYQSFNSSTYQLNMLLFLGAIYSAEKNIRVNEIKLDDNHIKTHFIFFNIKHNFPDLQTVSINGNTIDPSKIPGIEKQGITINGSPVATQQETSAPNPFSAYLSATMEPSGYFAQQASTLMQSTELLGFQDVSSITENDFNDIFCMQLDPEEFPTNQFFIDFIDCSWSEIPSLKRFYYADARFSISVDECGPGSPLQQYQKYSRNLLEDGANIVVGVNQIIEAQTTVFGTGFWGKPNRVEFCQLSDTLFANTFHGVLMDSDAQLLGYHRSFVVRSNRGKYEILNDHIFLHGVVLPQIE